jgi:hypothetical protein
MDGGQAKDRFCGPAEHRSRNETQQEHPRCCTCGRRSVSDPAGFCRTLPDLAGISAARSCRIPRIYDLLPASAGKSVASITHNPSVFMASCRNLPDFAELRNLPDSAGFCRILPDVAFSQPSVKPTSCRTLPDPQLAL